MFELSGKKALVTGATGGIGASIARALHAQGVEVSLSGTRTDSLDQLAGELKSCVHVIPCNLSDGAEAAALIGRTEEVMGRLDIVVNNAGITRDNLLIRMKDEQWQEVLDINLTAGFYLVRAALRGMMKRRFGRIIGITSVVGVSGNAGQCNYAAAKAGMIGMTKSVAQEVANRNITVNCIAPGFIKTAMTDVLNETHRESILKTVPSGRVGTPDDISSAVVYLASEEASYVTGQTLHINGGMLMV